MTPAPNHAAMQAMSSAGDLLRVTDSGLYCERGDFYVDPWRRVPRAVITHAHADHARAGSDRYLCAAEGQLRSSSESG